MAKVIYYAITSIDSYIADEDGNFDWNRRRGSPRRGQRPHAVVGMQRIERHVDPGEIRQLKGAADRDLLVGVSTSPARRSDPAWSTSCTCSSRPWDPAWPAPAMWTPPGPGSCVRLTHDDHASGRPQTRNP